MALAEAYLPGSTENLHDYLIPTAPVILAKIHDAVGVRIRRLPATPDRVRAALAAAGP